MRFAFHPILRVEERGFFGDAWAFTKSAGSGLKNAAVNTAEGVVNLAKGGYNLATDGEAREKAWETTKAIASKAKDYGSKAIDDPEKAWSEARAGATTMWNEFKAAKDKAAAEGRSAEFWGDITGTGGFEVLSTLVGVGAVSKLKKATDAADTMVDIGKGLDKASDMTKGADKAKDAIKSPAKKLPDTKPSDCADCPNKLGTSGKAGMPKQDSFKTDRVIDLDNLSPDDRRAAKWLEEQGWSDSKIKEILSSGDGFQMKPKNRGDKLYGITSKGHQKSMESPYWLDEDGYNNIKRKFQKDGRLDSAGVKEFLALPCYNKADSLDLAEITEDTFGIESRIGGATETIYSEVNGAISEVPKGMKGGGKQITINPLLIKKSGK